MTYPNTQNLPEKIGGLGAMEYRPNIDALVTMIERFTKDSAIDIDKLDRLLNMRDEIVNRQYEQLFNNSMADAQADMEPVRTDLANDQTRSRYASYAAIDRAIRPIYSRCGFSLSFNMGDSPTPDTVRVVCYCSHRGGFTRSYHVDVPADGKGPRGGEVMSRTHALGSAVSYGRRYLVNMIFNIAVESEDDGNHASSNRHRNYREDTRGRVNPTSTSNMKSLYEKARIAADQGSDAFKDFCKKLTKQDYESMKDFLVSLKSAVLAADANRGKHQTQETQTLEEEISNSDDTTSAEAGEG